jgi:hypothetical protein
MEKVIGIGGFFFRADNPEALSRWYADNLGISPPPPDYDSPSWRQTAGTTIFSAFPKNTTYFGKPEKQ